jgi:glycosyltransferase involved in cell wall biosynthesis
MNDLLNYHMACDALETVKLHPACAPQWERLCVLAQLLTAEHKPMLVDAVVALPALSREAHWLRCGALVFLTRQPIWLVQQAALADSHTRIDALGALLGLIWFHALARTPDRQSFTALLKDINLPRLQRLMAQKLPTPEGVRRVPVSPLRVAIYTPQVFNDHHGGTQFTLTAMSLAAQLGWECRAFSAQEATMPEANCERGGPETFTPLQVEHASLALHGPGDVPLMLAHGEFSLRFRLAQMLATIDDFAPDLIIFVGFVSPLVYRLHAHYPVLGLSLHAMPPLVPVDVWLSADAQGRGDLWPDLPAPEVAHFPYRFWPKGPMNPVDLTRLSIPACAVVLVTTGHRLNTEMPAPWCNQMLGFMEAQAGVHWLLIGPVPAELAEHPRLHVMAPTKGLAAWLAACDVYVNPPRIGGGASVAMAMEQGLPVLTLANNDGADKVGAWAQDTPADYFAQLTTWVTDAAARQQAGLAQQALFHSRLNVASVNAREGLMQAGELAIERFKQRLKQDAQGLHD